jgi:hypothetical protein
MSISSRKKNKKTTEMAEINISFCGTNKDEIVFGEKER